MGMFYGKSSKINNNTSPKNQVISSDSDDVSDNTRAINQIVELEDEIISLNNQIKNLRSYSNEMERAISHYKNFDKNETSDEISDKHITTDVEYLVLSGGGIKGICHCGSLLELDGMNKLFDVNSKLKLKGVCGVSAGSIVASLLAIGYTPKEILAIVEEIDFEQIADDQPGYIRDTINFVKNWGICKGIYIQELMKKLIEVKTGNPNYTIDDLYKDKGISLVIVATNLTRKRSIYFHPNHPTYFDLPIYQAVRMSMSIPFLFEPFIYQSEYWADGGLLDNYPIHVFDGAYPGDPHAKANLADINKKVLGIKIETNKSIEISQDIVVDPINDIGEYCLSYVETFLYENDEQYRNINAKVRTIVNVTPDYPLTKFAIVTKEKDELLDIGRVGVKAYFGRQGH